MICLGSTWVVVPQWVLGQSEYAGAYRLGPWQGEAAFSYHLEKGDTIFQGPFHMERRDLGTSAAADNYFRIEGQYARNIPQGGWIFQFGKLRSNGSVSVTDDEYQLRLDGTLHRVAGELLDGRYHGKWLHEVHEIRNSKTDRQLFKSEVQFESGIPQLAIQIENQNNVLLGRFLRNGLAHDVWTLFTNQQQSEHWHFKDGRLEKIMQSLPQGSKELEIFPAIDGTSREINLDSNYLTLIDVALEVSGLDYDAGNSATAQLILENSRSYEKVQELLLSKQPYEIPIPFRVVVPYQPLTDLQTNDFNAISGNLLAIDSFGKDVISSSSINIAKVTDEEISYWQAIISSLSKDYLKPVRTLAQYFDREILDYIPGEALWAYLWPDGHARRHLDIQYEILGSETTRTYTFPQPDSLFIRQGETSDLVRLTSSVLTQIDSIRGLIYAKVQSAGDPGRFADVEQKLIDTLETLNQMLDSAQMDGRPGQALEKIRTQAREELAKYSSLVDINAKRIQANIALNCLSDLKGLTRQITLIPSRWELIQAAYTDKVWNNFTSTVMSEDVKKRIPRSYRDIMVPYFLDLVSSELSCMNAKQLGGIFEQAYDRIHHLRHEDTTKLERKLRNQDDPEAVMDLMDLDPANLLKS